MKRTRLVALFAALVLVAAACGDSGNDTTTAAPGTDAPTTTQGGTDTTAAASTTAAPGMEAGQGGDLLLLQWQAATHLNPYTGTGTKDIQAASLVIEPLLEYDSDGNLSPSLVAEIPTLANGGGPDPTHVHTAARRRVVGRHRVHVG